MIVLIGVPIPAGLTDKVGVQPRFQRLASLGTRLGRYIWNRASINHFTITAEIYARSLANFYCQYADRHMNLKFMRRVSAREPAIRQFVIVKNKLMSVLMSLSPY